MNFVVLYVTVSLFLTFSYFFTFQFFWSFRFLAISGPVTGFIMKISWLTILFYFISPIIYLKTATLAGYKKDLEKWTCQYNFFTWQILISRPCEFKYVKSCEYNIAGKRKCLVCTSFRTRHVFYMHVICVHTLNCAQ